MIDKKIKYYQFLNIMLNKLFEFTKALVFVFE